MGSFRVHIITSNCIIDMLNNHLRFSGSSGSMYTPLLSEWRSLRKRMQVGIYYPTVAWIFRGHHSSYLTGMWYHVVSFIISSLHHSVTQCGWRSLAEPKNWGDSSAYLVYDWRQCQSPDGMILIHLPYMTYSSRTQHHHWLYNSGIISTFIHPPTCTTLCHLVNTVGESWYLLLDMYTVMVA